MNGVGENRYSGNWEKLSYRLRLLYPCLICGENDLNKKECHHLDGNKKNSTPSNAAVLCSNCHRELHKGNIKIPCDFEGYRETRGYSVTVAHHTSSMGEWFDSTKRLKN